MSEQSEMSDFLRERYGNRYGEPSSRWKPYAAFIAFAFLLWTLWSALHAANPNVRHQLISFQSTSDSSISITYSATFRQTSSEGHFCRLVARDFQKNVVGEITDKLSGSSGTQTKTTVIPTRVKAVNAGVLDCI